MTATKAPQPIETMSRDELQASCAITTENIKRDEAEYATLPDRMQSAAEAGDDGEWIRLNGLYQVLPTKMTGQTLRVLSIRILLAKLDVASNEAEREALHAPYEAAQATFEAAQKEWQAVQRSTQWAGEEQRERRRHLADLQREREAAQIAASRRNKPPRVLSGAL